MLVLQGVAPASAATPIGADKGAAQTETVKTPPGTVDSGASTGGNRSAAQPEIPDNFDVKLIVIIRPANR